MAYWAQSHVFWPTRVSHRAAQNNPCARALIYGPRVSPPRPVTISGTWALLVGRVLPIRLSRCNDSARIDRGAGVGVFRAPRDISRGPLGLPH
jgi:hypothetical protein